MIPENRIPTEFWINLQSAYDLARCRPAQAIKHLATVG